MNILHYTLIFLTSITLLLGSTQEIFGEILVDDFAFLPHNIEKFLQNPLDEASIPIRISTLDVSGIAPFSPGVTLGLASFTPVGGEYITLDQTTLLVSGAQTNLAWIIPVLAAAGIGAVLIRKKF